MARRKNKGPVSLSAEMTPGFAYEQKPSLKEREFRVRAVGPEVCGTVQSTGFATVIDGVTCAVFVARDLTLWAQPLSVVKKARFKGGS